MIIKRVVVLSPLTYCEDGFTNGGVGCGADFWRFPKACPNGQIRDVSSGQCVCPNANEEVVNDSGGNPSCLQKCDANQERLPITNNCVAKCGADEQRNPATNLCEKPPLCDNPAVGKSAKSSTIPISLPVSFIDLNGKAPKGRYTRQCGRCTIIYDNDKFKGPHTHWQCPGQPQGCIKTDGTLCDGSAMPPPKVAQCLQDWGRIPEPPPTPTCGDNCKKVWKMVTDVLTGLLVLPLVTVCVPVGL